MTEGEWNASADPFALLRCWPEGTAQRKRLLLVCAAWQPFRLLLSEERNRQALDALERLAEGTEAADRGAVAWTALQIEEPLWPRIWDEAGGFRPAWTAETAALAATILVCTAALDHGDAFWASTAEAERAAESVVRDGTAVARAWCGQLAHLAAVIRDLVRYPADTPSPVAPAWLVAGPDGRVVELARTIYDERRFSDLPILADALEEAGCTDPVILTHLRGPGPHARGCWCLDAVLQQGGS